MTDEELIAELRKPWFTNGCERYQLDAADRIEALVKERDEAKRLMQARHREMLAADGLMRKHQRRAERMEAALREIESISVHSGGEIHGVTALHWELAFGHAQDVASAALK